MGFGAYHDVELRLTALDGPLEVVPSELHVMPTDQNGVFEPVTCRRLPERPKRPDGSLGLDDPIRLQPGEGIWVEYACRPEETESFDLRLRLCEPGTAVSDRILHFERSGSIFVGWILWAPG